MIETEWHGRTAVVRLAYGKVNEMDGVMLRALAATLRDLEGECEAVVLTGNGRVFSAGANLPGVVDAPAEQIADGLDALTEAFRALFAFARPAVAAVDGPAIAGGCVLVCACDHRVAVSEGAVIGLAELRVGVPFPTAALEVVRHAVGSRLEELVLFGRNYDPPEALARGLVDELAEPGRVLDVALERAAELARIPAGTYAHTKRALRRPAIERMDAAAPADDPRVAELWASDEVRAAIRRFLDELAGARRG